MKQQQDPFPYPSCTQIAEETKTEPIIRPISALAAKSFQKSMLFPHKDTDQADFLNAF